MARSRWHLGRIVHAMVATDLGAAKDEQHKWIRTHSPCIFTRNVRAGGTTITVYAVVVRILSPVEG